MSRKLTPAEAEFAIKSLMELRQFHIVRILSIEERMKEIILDLNIDCETTEARNALSSALLVLNHIKESSKGKG